MVKRVSFSGPMRQALGGTIQRDYMMDPRRIMAQQFIEQGSSTAPVQSWQEGLARALTAGVGGYFGGQARREMQDREAQYGQDMAKVLAAAQGTPGTPQGGHPGLMDVPAAPGSPGGFEGMQTALAGINNPDLADFGQQIAMSQIEQDIAAQQAETARQQELQDYERKLQLEQQYDTPSASEETWGKTPVWGTDAQGNQVIGVISDQGNFKPLDTGDFSLTRKGLTKTDVGNEFIYTDALGNVVSRQPKSLAPEQTPEHKGAVTEAQEAAKTAAAAEQGELGVLGKKAGEYKSNLYETVQSAVATAQKADDLINLLETGDVTTGIGAEMVNGINRLRAAMGDDIAAGRVSDTEVANAMMGSDVFGMIKALGVGARGLDTPAEREFMREVLTGTISLNKDTLVRMAKIRKDVSQRAIDKWNKMSEAGDLDSFYKAYGIEKQPLGISSGDDEWEVVQ